MSFLASFWRSPPAWDLSHAHEYKKGTSVLFQKSRQQIADVVATPAKNASLLSIVALTLSLIAIMVAVAMGAH